MIAVDAVPDSVGTGFVPARLATDDVAYLQYTSGSTRTPAGVEITHRSACTNVLQMILSIGLDWNIPVSDVKLVAAGAIPRTTSGKLAHRARRAEYLPGKL